MSCSKHELHLLLCTITWKIASSIANMIFKFAFATRVREIVRVLRGLPPDQAVRDRTVAINEQLARLRATRIAQEKVREEAALREVQFVVEEMERLKESLTAAEEAAVEFVNQIGDHAQAQLEEEWEQKAKTLVAEFMAEELPLPRESTPCKADVPVPSLAQEGSPVSNTRTTVVETNVTP
uniref:Uncharacterized protein n=3 Tax=Physcomitrium patens TaxID=3218 RepID=A0A2K1IRT5_PHYPA|nr:uncharacterized protein LOC112274245 isoform X1 [Physcomitrium patens]PNR31989.1 hypothetical protein PHYPA_026113 [Physcomitrium patens]|eukprot:XP_024359324.1 uncharacterized protein LOC112274245 isoform X1 [Physcomitrella patens]